MAETYNNITGLEVDSILELFDDDYAAVEIRLGSNQIEEATKNLLTFQDNIVKKPKLKCIIVCNYQAVVKDPKTGIYILPITALKP